MTGAYAASASSGGFSDARNPNTRQPPVLCRFTKLYRFNISLYLKRDGGKVVRTGRSVVLVLVRYFARSLSHIYSSISDSACSSHAHPSSARTNGFPNRTTSAHSYVTLPAVLENISSSSTNVVVWSVRKRCCRNWRHRSSRR